MVPKHAVITWLAILNRLPTVDRLKAWGIDKDGLCSLCKQEQESRDHLFFECSYSKAVWKKVLQLCGLNREVLDWRREFAWAVQKFKGKALITKILKISWNAYIYCIWKERNNRLFVHKEESIEQVLEHIQISVRFRLAGLRDVAVDSVNVSLCSSWKLFDSILVQS